MNTLAGARSVSINDYLNNHTFQYWLNENFDADEIQNLLDSIASDGIYPEAFILWCYDAMAFDQQHTVYPILAEACEMTNPSFEEEEIDHEFHFFEAPLHDNESFNMPLI